VSALIVVIVGPTGVGKTTVCRLLEARGISRIASTTTRSPWSDEVAGRDLHPVSVNEFVRMRERGEFLAPVRYGEADYGVQHQHLNQAARHGGAHTLVIEPSGLADIKRWTLQANVTFFSVMVFAHPELIRRQLRARYAGTNRSEEYNDRALRAASEAVDWGQEWNYDIITTNQSSELVARIVAAGVNRRLAQNAHVPSAESAELASPGTDFDAHRPTL
jgi:guanylate kinase